MSEDLSVTFTSYDIHRNGINYTCHDMANDFMELLLFVDSDDLNLKQLYINHANKHNSNISANPFYDAGFDLFLPKQENEYKLLNNGTLKTLKIDFKVKCCAKIYKSQNKVFLNTPFYTYARSSLSKMPLRLANNQGIIDAGYRGNLIGMFDTYEENYKLEDYTRLLQICAPSLIPIYVRIVDTLEELGEKTGRGEGGFGSTGKSGVKN